MTKKKKTTNRDSQKNKEWHDKLSPAAKAEILATILHDLECHMPKVWDKLPNTWRKVAEQAAWDCSILFTELTKTDIKLIDEWFSNFDVKKD